MFQTSRELTWFHRTAANNWNCYKSPLGFPTLERGHRLLLARRPPPTSYRWCVSPCTGPLGGAAVGMLPSCPPATSKSLSSAAQVAELGLTDHRDHPSVSYLLPGCCKTRLRLAACAKQMLCAHDFPQNSVRRTSVHRAVRTTALGLQGFRFVPLTCFFVNL